MAALTASLAVLLFNPLTAKSDRLAEIYEEVQNFDIIVLTGTSRRRRDPSITQHRSADTRFYEAGWQPGDLTNRSTGIIIALQ
eukprot:3584041-Pyramimonas_sp.AAC.1